MFASANPFFEPRRVSSGRHVPFVLDRRGTELFDEIEEPPLGPPDLGSADEDRPPTDGGHTVLLTMVEYKAVQEDRVARLGAPVPIESEIERLITALMQIERERDQNTLLVVLKTNQYFHVIHL